jgi:hypothetical protein
MARDDAELGMNAEQVLIRHRICQPLELVSR